jgi:hypothetical protein
MRLDYLQRIDLGMGLVKQQHGTGIAILAEVSHDDHCKLSKKNPCNCSPDVVLRVNGIKYDVDADGYPKIKAG